ncbi:hypothetical protein FQR65_LT09388, partial [Abscondita terminalis]
RYLLYDVNPPEGFNLRRDVYMRYAVLSHNLMKSSEPNLSNFKLVLPPWTNLYHWQNEELVQIPWSYFFDISSLQKFAPVIEMHEFFKEIGPKYSKLKLQDVYILQHFKDMFETGKFDDKMEIQKCNKPIRTNFYYYNNVTSDNIKCLSFHGPVQLLQKILKITKAQTILIDHAEVALHNNFGNNIYWQARRSMRFNKHLQNLASKFRQKYLNSTDLSDNTQLPNDWRDEKYRRNARGGPYLSVHFRRKDFAASRPNDVPTVESAAKQIIDILKKENLNIVFIATDASSKEYEQLKSFLRHFVVYRYIPDEDVKKGYTDGQQAIIEQIICSHAKYFVGTCESTFSFRIQEEREIMGFRTQTTFNCLCGNNSNNCNEISVWKIV